MYVDNHLETRCLPLNFSLRGNKWGFKKKKRKAENYGLPDDAITNGRERGGFEREQLVWHKWEHDRHTVPVD